MNIIGAGASTTIIDANGPVTADRGFRIVPGITVNITALTVRNGATTKGGGLANVAGGIYNEGTLTLTRVVVSDSSAELDGGIRNELGALMTLVDCVVTGNKATKMNSAVGGIRNDGTMTLMNTTVSNNQTSGPGGGIVNGGQLVMINSTVSGNRADASGGGIFNIGVMNVFNSTITKNTANANGAVGKGGGVVNVVGNTFTFQDTILAENDLRFIFDECVGELISQGNNLMRFFDETLCTVRGSAPILAVPQLGALQNNGGQTPTHAPLPGSPAIDAASVTGCRDNLGAVLATDQRGLPRGVNGDRCDIGAVEVQPGAGVVAAVLPGSRSVQIGATATAFAAIINTGGAPVTACNITPATNIPAVFHYQTTNAANQVVGTPDTPVDIQPGAAQNFIFSFTPNQPFPPTDVRLVFDCADSNPAPSTSGLNTLLLSASATPVPDIVALAATAGGQGVVDIPGANGAAAVSVATVSVGAGASITASADTGGTTLPITLAVCQTNPQNGACLAPPGGTVTTTINAGATPTFSVFVIGAGSVPFDPAANRVFMRFKDAGAITRGSTNVAVRTQ